MKRLISALLCAIMLVSTVVSAAALRGNEGSFNMMVEEEAYIVGDANGDGTVDMADSLELKKASAGIATVDGSAGDVNCDGIVNAKDLLVLKKCNAEVDSIENYVSDKALDGFDIAGNDISEYTIVYHEDAKYVENNYYAADSLRKFINISTGIDVNVATESATEHKIEFVDVTTIEGLEEKLEIENYKYEVVDGDLYIYGTWRGAMYAVYEIAEEYLGLRFYNDVFTYQYSVRHSEIEEGTEVYHDPYLEFRICRQGFWRKDETHYFPRRLNGSQHGSVDVYLGTLTGPHFINAHSYGYYYQMATGAYDVNFDGTNHWDYGKKADAGVVQSPKEWNPCYTSDYEYATLFRGLLETMRYVQGWNVFRDETSCMSFSICDNGTTCSCRDCRYIMTDAVLDPKGTRGLGCGAVGLYLYISNKACKDIKAYYEGRPASIEEWGDGEFSNYGYGEAIKDAYPNMRLFTIFYDNTPPHELLFTDERYEPIRPADNLIIMYCGNPCNSHFYGSDECQGNVNIVGSSSEKDAAAFKAWGEVAKITGSDVWFWYYPTNYNTYVTDSPNIFNIWHDFKFVVDECNVTGLYYEGSSKGYLFENLKSHLAAQFMWSMVENEDGSVSYMSYDEFIECMKEYLRIHYGKGWEYVYEYICMQDEASNTNIAAWQDGHANPIYDENGEMIYTPVCYVNNVDYMGDMFSYTYIRDNYEYMRDLVLKGMALVPETDVQMYQRYEFLLMNVETMGLSAVRKSWYLDPNADPEKKALYMERYDWLFNFLKYEDMNYFTGGPDGREWNADGSDMYQDYVPFRRIMVHGNKDVDWMDQVPSENYYEYSPYMMITGDFESNGVFEPGMETWRKYGEGWEWAGSVPGWS